MRLAQVVRTSQRKQDALSPQQQREIGESFERRTGHQIVRVHDSGRSESGKTMDRAALHSIREDVRSGALDGAFVAYLDRMGRAPIEESMTFMRGLTEVDGGVLIAGDWNDDPIDLSNPDVEDMLVFRLQMNRSMWNKAAARSAFNKRSALKRGAFLGPVPFGYRKQKKGGRIERHEFEAQIVREAFRLAAADGIDAARDYLELSAPDARVWRIDMVRKLIANRTYLGEHAKRGLVAGVDPETGATVPYPPHDALVTEELFDAAQSKPRPRRGNRSYLLSQLVWCECGEHLIGQAQHGKRVRYRCAAGHYSCGADDLNEIVRGECRGLLASKTVRDRVQPSGVDEALLAYEAAKTARRRYQLAIDNLDSDDVSGWAEGAAAVEKRVKDTHAVYRQLAAQSAAFERLPLAEEMNDDEQLQAGLRILASRGLRFVVARGSNRPLVERVRLDDEVVAGALAA